MTRARARRIARGEEEENDDSDDNDNPDDDVFSAFGDDHEEGSQSISLMQTQEDLPAASAAAASMDGNNNNDDINNNNNNNVLDQTQPQQQEQQHEEQQQQNEEDPSSEAMQGFFQHMTSTTQAASTTTKTLSYKEWKVQRKQFLMDYFTHRLIGVDNEMEDDDENEEAVENCSFHSGVLDEAFENDHVASTTATAAALNENDESEEDDDDDDDDDEEEELLQTQQQLETQEEGGIFSGIKRKLGFLSQSQEDEDEKAAADENNNNNNSGKKHKKAKMIAMSPGQMWDGRLSSIPHISESDASGRKCFQLKDMDLSSSLVNLGLCRVVKIWGVRFTKRMERLNEEILVSDSNDNDNDDAFGSWDDDGPLNTIYKKVLSIEVVQLDNHGDDTPLSMVTPFHNTTDQPARKRRHTLRRVRIFFYNKYADVMHALFQNLSDSFVKARKSPVLVSLADVPSKCIMPLSMTDSSRRSGVHPHLQQYVNNPFGDEEWGVSSPYCICVGDKSTMKLGDEGRIRFDAETMEICVVEAPVGLDHHHLLSSNDTDDDVVNGIDVNDAKITATSIRGNGHGYFLEAESKLIRRYLNILKRKKEESEIECQNLVFNAEDYEAASSASRHDVHNVGIAGLRGTAASRHSNNVLTGETNNSENTDPNANSGSANGEIVRPRTVAPLGSLSTILLQGRNDSITVYGVVLGFSPPRITRMNMWMMSIVLIDETMPTSRERDVGGNNEKELHVPSITLNLFVKHKSELPPVRSAGDVICCQKVILQEYNNEPQLRAKKISNIIVARPRLVRCPENPLHNSTSPDDWFVSDERHALDLDLANGLWRWGQLRLSTHPTMSPNCYLAISQVSDHVDNFEVSVSGDITAVVTSILPTPEHLRRSDTPRGFLRLWDGTGPSRSDPMPERVVGVSADQSVADPPQQVLVRIEKILKAIASLEQPDTTCSGVSAPLALCGRVINAIIWEEDMWNLIQRDGIINIGSFVRLRNINNAMLPSGYRVNCLSVHAKSSLTPLPHDAYEVKMLLKGHDTRLKRGVPTNPTSAILPGNSSGPRPQFTRGHGHVANREFSMLDECLRKPAPATFTVQFEVSHTLPTSDINSIDTLKAFCVKQKDGKAVFRFALHIKDASSEVDVICHGKVAEELLGMTPQEVSTSVAKCNQALANLKEYTSAGAVCEGTIRSVMGKDERVYFVLLSMFCITS